MELNTAASVISFISKIEQDSADLYEQWGRMYGELKELFLSFAKDNNWKRSIYWSWVSSRKRRSGEGYSFWRSSQDSRIRERERTEHIY